MLILAMTALFFGGPGSVTGSVERVGLVVSLADETGHEILRFWEKQTTPYYRQPPKLVVIEGSQHHDHLNESGEIYAKKLMREHDLSFIVEIHLTKTQKARFFRGWSQGGHFTSMAMSNAFADIYFEDMAVSFLLAMLNDLGSDFYARRLY